MIFFLSWAKFLESISINFIFLCVINLTECHIEFDNFIFTDICDDFCQNGGRCSVEGGKPKCDCPVEFEGKNCEKRK